MQKDETCSPKSTVDISRFASLFITEMHVELKCSKENLLLKWVKKMVDVDVTFFRKYVQ